MLSLSHRLGEYSKCGVKRYSHSFRVTCDKSAASLLESWEQRCIKAINNNFQESEQVRRLKKSLLCFTGTWVNLTTLKNRSRSGDWRRLFRTPGTTWSKCCACRIKWFSGELAGLISSLLDHCFSIQPACWLCTWTWWCFEPHLLILWFCGLNVAIWYIYIYMCLCVLNSLISMLERGYVLVFLSAPSAACWASFALHAFIRRCFELLAFILFISWLECGYVSVWYVLNLLICILEHGYLCWTGCFSLCPLSCMSDQLWSAHLVSALECGCVLKCLVSALECGCVLKCLVSALECGCVLKCLVSALECGCVLKCLVSARECGCVLKCLVSALECGCVLKCLVSALECGCVLKCLVSELECGCVLKCLVSALECGCVLKCLVSALECGCVLKCLVSALECGCMLSMLSCLVSARECGCVLNCLSYTLECGLCAEVPDQHKCICT